MLPDIVPDPPIRAKVRFGVKENGRPRATETFRSTDPVFTEQLGTPATIDITIPFSDPRLALKDGLELWLSNQTLKCWSSDGAAAHRLDANGKYQDTTCKYKECPQFNQGNCKQIGRLRFRIPSLGPGLFVIDTHGWNSIKQMLGTLTLHAPIDPAQHWRLSLKKEKNAKKQTYTVLNLEPIENTPDTGGETDE